MKIAFPTMDGQSISAHFGRSKGFLVLDAQGSNIQGREVREHNQASTGQDHTDSGGCQGHAHGEGHGHNHAGFARLLQDCQVLVVQGMGAGAVQAFEQAGIRICHVEEDCTPEEAVNRLASDSLDDLKGGTCGCGGHAH